MDICHGIAYIISYLEGKIQHAKADGFSDTNLSSLRRPPMEVPPKMSEFGEGVVCMVGTRWWIKIAGCHVWFILRNCTFK